MSATADTAAWGAREAPHAPTGTCAVCWRDRSSGTDAKSNTGSSCTVSTPARTSSRRCPTPAESAANAPYVPRRPSSTLPSATENSRTCSS